MIVARTKAEARSALRRLPRPLGLVPTMGALHPGHLSLVTAARERCAAVAASLFVNPTQFAADEDFHLYPRDEARDLRLFEETGVAVVFAPSAEEMYADRHSTAVRVSGPLTGSYEAAQRPGHFDGVATVVAKLLAIVQPEFAFFGQKDAQQLAVIRRLVRDLDLPVEVAGVPTMREPDGLAMSSRNAYLSPEQRAAAPDLYLALLAGARTAARPGAGPKDVIATACTALAGHPAFTIDYIAVVDADSFVAEEELGPRSVLIGAARLGATRLLDNIPLGAALAAPRSATAPTHASAYPAGDATD